LLLVVSWTLSFLTPACRLTGSISSANANPGFQVFQVGAPGRMSRSPVTLQAHNQALAEAAAVFAHGRDDESFLHISGHSMRRTAVRLFEARNVRVDPHVAVAHGNLAFSLFHMSECTTTPRVPNESARRPDAGTPEGRFKRVPHSVGMKFTRHKSVEVYMHCASQPSIRMLTTVANAVFTAAAPSWVEGGSEA
jgi:hypothetical protein